MIVNRKNWLVLTCTLAVALVNAQSPEVPKKIALTQPFDSVGLIKSLPKALNVGISDSLSTKIQPSESSAEVLRDSKTQRIDSLQARLSSRLDSLSKLPNPDKKLIEVLSAYRTRLDSLRAPPGVGSVVSAGQASRAEVDKALSGVEDKVNEKLSLFSENGANVPGAAPSGNLSHLLPGANTSMPNAGSIPALNGIMAPSTAVPNLGVPSLPGTSIPSTNIPQVDVAIPDLKGVSVPAIPDLKTSVPEIGNVKGEMGKVNGVMQEASGYKEDIKTITSGNLDSLNAESIEKRIVQLDGVSDAGDQLLDGAQQAEMIKKWQSDPAYKRELAVTQAKEFSVNHFAGHESELLAVMDQLAQARTKVKDIEQVVDLFEKPANPMKDKPFIERLRPGVNLQLQWSNIVILDINPYVGYRLSGRWTTGIGWNERIGFSSDSYSFSSLDRVYGPRAFVHFKFKESNFLILSPELMHAVVPGHTVHTGESTSKWVPGLMGGYRREFRYSKKVIGTVQFLYNIVAPAGQSPYASRFNVLFGFEFPLKKKPKSV